MEGKGGKGGKLRHYSSNKYFSKLELLFRIEIEAFHLFIK